MLAVSRDVLANINTSLKSLDPQRGSAVSPWRGRDILPNVWNVSVINLPDRSTAFTCRHTELRSLILYPYK